MKKAFFAFIGVLACAFFPMLAVVAGALMASLLLVFLGCLALALFPIAGALLFALWFLSVCVVAEEAKQRWTEVGIGRNSQFFLFGIASTLFGAALSFAGFYCEVPLSTLYWVFPMALASHFGVLLAGARGIHRNKTAEAPSNRPSQISRDPN